MTSLKENEESALAGMVGAMVVAKRYGKKYLRRAPRRAEDSLTPAQVLHRQRFTSGNSYCKQFKNTLLPLPVFFLR